MRQTIIHILTVLRVDVIDVPGERRQRQRHRPSYADPPSRTSDFINAVSTMSAGDLADFDSFCHARGLPLNLDSLWMFEARHQPQRRPPARVFAPTGRRSSDR